MMKLLDLNLAVRYGIAMRAGNFGEFEFGSRNTDSPLQTAKFYSPPKFPAIQYWESYKSVIDS